MARGNSQQSSSNQRGYVLHAMRSNRPRRVSQEVLPPECVFPGDPKRPPMPERGKPGVGQGENVPQVLNAT